MTRPTQHSYATEADLAWFRLQNYAALPGREDDSTESHEERKACLNVWASIIRDRAEICRLFEAGMTEQVLPLLERLKADPLSPLGFHRRYNGPDHVSGTPTIKPLSANRTKALHNLISNSAEESSQVVDDLLLNNKEGFDTTQGHIIVDLSATDEQLRKDFNTWLASRRAEVGGPTQSSHRKKIRNWVSKLILPYYDLMLFSRISGKNVAVNSRYQMLHPRATANELSDTAAVQGWLRTLDKLVNATFNDETARLLEHMAQS